MLQPESKIYVAGHRGLVGSAILRQLEKNGLNNIISRTHGELDLTNQKQVQDFFLEEKPEYVILAAAKVGGIHANSTYPADFIYNNLIIEANVVDASYRNNVKRLLFLGSSCIYPKGVSQPMREEAILTGVLEPTNEPYALAKIAGIKLCESYNRQYETDYRSVMPTNLYGQGDNFHPENSHVIPGLMRRFHEAKVNGDNEIVVWGSGNAMREFLHVDDMASASLFILGLDRNIYQKNTKPMLSHINVGSGKDCTIRELAESIKTVTGYSGNILFDTSKPDGTLRKLMDTSRLNHLGWTAEISLKEGLQLTYDWYLNNIEQSHIRT
ncbi:MAG TPA: GDP-L-fucose synthase [Gammaproteobacteria bacterium]|nr:GDP-L-fucose synthase [Gammaproteobacteria bacterium]